MRRHRPRRHFGLPLMACLISAVTLSSCALLKPALRIVEDQFDTHGGGETIPILPRKIDPADVRLPPGYRIEAIARNLTYPTCVLTDDDNRVYVVEGGYSYGERYDTAKLLRLEADGSLTTIAASDSHRPWTGAVFHQGAFFISENGHPGRIIRVTPDGAKQTILDGLPGKADHHVNQPVIGPDGYLYFGRGAITNSAVPGVDNAFYAWLLVEPKLHDIPGQAITLRGKNFTTLNPLTPQDPFDKATSGAFMPFGHATVPGQVVPAGLPATAAIMRVRPDGRDLQLVAWGIRNPYDVAFSPDGRLFATEQGYDKRGSRPVANAPDLLLEVRPGTWYGWPDYSGDTPLTDPRFKPEDGPQPEFLLAEHPQKPPKPKADLGVHTGSVGLDFSRNAAFGYPGQVFIAQFGDGTPSTGVVPHPQGFKVVRVDPATGRVEDFAVNEGAPGPASKIGNGGLERPIDIAFDRTGSNMYVLDFGVFALPVVPLPKKETGVLWRVTRAD